MKLKLYSFILIGFSALVVSCKTASKMYEKGNYDEAVELAAKKLQKDPDDPKLLGIIRHAYDYALNDHESRIRNLEQSSNELKWESIYYEYVSLQKMYDAIYKVPSVLEIVKPVDYSGNLITFREKAGEIRYERGIAFMQHYDKQSYRNAYREFQAALRFIPGDRDAMLKMEEAYDYAVTNVVVLPLQQDGGYVYSNYIVGQQNLDDQMIRSLQNYSGSEFVKFYSAWDARSRKIRTDQVLDMRLARVNIGGFQDIRSTRRVSKEVVIKETVYRPDSIVREYGKVYADITTTKRSMYSDAVLTVDVRDEDGRRLWRDDFAADHDWNTEFSTYKGDSRALSAADKQMVDRFHEMAPSENDIVKCMLDEINNNALYRIRNYFARL